jgi:hypothetical protein
MRECFFVLGGTYQFTKVPTDAMDYLSLSTCLSIVQFMKEVSLNLVIGTAFYFFKYNHIGTLFYQYVYLVGEGRCLFLKIKLRPRIVHRKKINFFQSIDDSLLLGDLIRKFSQFNGYCQDTGRDQLGNWKIRGFSSCL